MAERVTIKTIARDLGVSHMTVSRALSNHPNVQKETRDAILKHAQELGYVRSAAANAMRGEGMRIVGLLLPNIVNEFYARFADTMAKACEDAAFHLTIHLTRDDIQAEAKALKRLHEIQAKAVVMVPTPGACEAELPQLRAMQVVQLIRERPLGFEVPRIIVQDADAIRDAVAHLASKGHRKIGYIGASIGLSSGRRRHEAFISGLAAAGLSAEPNAINTVAPEAEQGRAIMRRLLDDRSVTAVVCGGFELSNGALIAMFDAGVSPTGDFGFVGYGDPSFYSWVGSGIPTIAIPVADLAACAVARLEAPEAPAGRQAFPATFIAR